MGDDSARFSGGPGYRLVDRIELRDPTQGFRRDWRAGRLVNVKELAPCVRPTGCQHDVATVGQPLEPGITVNLQNAAECFEVRGGPLPPAVGTVEVDGCPVIGPPPMPIVSWIKPQTPRPCGTP